jgi:hypothetical protein
MFNDSITLTTVWHLLVISFLLGIGWTVGCWLVAKLLGKL